MSWGHAVSRDLLHWEQKDDVLFPDETGTMFSESGIVNDRKMDLRQIEDRAAMARKKAKGNMMNNVLYYQEEFQNGSKADREKAPHYSRSGLPTTQLR